MFQEMMISSGGGSTDWFKPIYFSGKSDYLNDISFSNSACSLGAEYIYIVNSSAWGQVFINNVDFTDYSKVTISAICSASSGGYGYQVGYLDSNNTYVTLARGDTGNGYARYVVDISSVNGIQKFFASTTTSQYIYEIIFTE